MFRPIAITAALVCMTLAGCSESTTTATAAKSDAVPATKAAATTTATTATKTTDAAKTDATKAAKADALMAAEKAMMPVNTVCVVENDDDADVTNYAMYKGQKVAFCCPGCANVWSKWDDAKRTAMVARAVEASAAKSAK